MKSSVLILSKIRPRTNHDKNKFVLLKRKFEPYWIDKYYQKGGKLYE